MLKILHRTYSFLQYLIRKPQQRGFEFLKNDRDATHSVSIISIMRFQKLYDNVLEVFFKLMYRIVIFCIFVGNSNLYAQKNIFHKERMLLQSTGIVKSTNPALLQEIKDSIILSAKINYLTSKGNFINYFQPNRSNQLKLEVYSYKRLNPKTVVYGLASYSLKKGHNAGKTSFLDPYKIPFNFIEREDSCKNDRKIENYSLVGAISHQITKKLTVGLKIDYQTLNFAKFRDIRNFNEILDLKADAGLSYQIGKNKIGASYRYKRYIESLVLMKEGLRQKDYYGLINRGSFIGLMLLYSGDGILELDEKTPWVAIANNFGLQYQFDFSSETKIFIDLIYEKENGYFGEEGNIAVMYYKHNKTNYKGNFKLVKKGDSFSHFFSCSADFSNLQNHERLHSFYTTEGNLRIIKYYGKNEIYNKKQTNISFKYDCLFGGSYTEAPYQLDFSCNYRKINRKSSFYPYFRKQNFSLYKAEAGISKLFKVQNTYLSLRLASIFVMGFGGKPIDGMYFASGGNTSSPDNLDELLYQEKEYLTNKRIIPNINIRAERSYKNKFRTYIQIASFYTKPFKTTYLKGNFVSMDMSVGLIF